MTPQGLIGVPRGISLEARALSEKAIANTVAFFRRFEGKAMSPLGRTAVEFLQEEVDAATNRVQEANRQLDAAERNLIEAEERLKRAEENEREREGLK